MKILLSIFAIFAITAVSAYAAPPVASGTISGPNEAAPYAFGDEITFTTTTSGLRGTQYPLVYVECYSVVDGTFLYGQLDHPIATFELGADSSQWHVQRDDANCNATLYAYGGKGQTPQIVELASLAFAADG